MSATAPRPLLTRSSIAELLARYRHLPRKTLGQNFVADPNTIRRIVALAGVTGSSSVVEIGPGLGSLTLGLAETARRVVAIEADRSLLDRGRITYDETVDLPHPRQRTAAEFQRRRAEVMAALGVEVHPGL